jgi:hypothetical protein
MRSRLTVRDRCELAALIGWLAALLAAGAFIARRGVL